MKIKYDRITSIIDRIIVPEPYTKAFDSVLSCDAKTTDKKQNRR